MALYLTAEKERSLLEGGASDDWADGAGNWARCDRRGLLLSVG